MEGNKLITIPDKAMPNLSRIVYENGGTTPDILTGLYTGFTMAQKAIKAYEALKPVHELQVYSHQKTITDDEEKELYEKVKQDVAEKNKKLEAESDGKKGESKTENEGGTEHVRKGVENRSQSSDVPGKRKSS